MTRQLPSKPSSEYLHKETKAILKAHRCDDPTCCEVLRNLHHLEEKTDKELLASNVPFRQTSLRELELTLGLASTAGHGFVSDLYKYFTACDFAIVQGGGTSILELTALNRPFIYFPIEGHSEQKLVSERLIRYNAGIRMDLFETTPAFLAEQVLINFRKSVSYGAIKTDGAKRAAKIINQFMSNEF